MTLDDFWQAVGDSSDSERRQHLVRQAARTKVKHKDQATAARRALYVAKVLEEDRHRYGSPLDAWNACPTSAIPKAWRPGVPDNPAGEGAGPSGLRLGSPGADVHGRSPAAGEKRGASLAPSPPTAPPRRRQRAKSRGTPANRQGTPGTGEDGVGTALHGASAPGDTPRVGFRPLRLDFDGSNVAEVSKQLAQVTKALVEARTIRGWAEKRARKSAERAAKAEKDLQEAARVIAESRDEKEHLLAQVCSLTRNVETYKALVGAARRRRTYVAVARSPKQYRRIARKKINAAVEAAIENVKEADPVKRAIVVLHAVLRIPAFKLARPHVLGLVMDKSAEDMAYAEIGKAAVESLDAMLGRATSEDVWFRRWACVLCCPGDMEHLEALGIKTLVQRMMHLPCTTEGQARVAEQHRMLCALELTAKTIAASVPKRAVTAEEVPKEEVDGIVELLFSHDLLVCCPTKPVLCTLPYKDENGAFKKEKMGKLYYAGSIRGLWDSIEAAAQGTLPDLKEYRFQVVLARCSWIRRLSSVQALQCVCEACWDMANLALVLKSVASELLDLSKPAPVDGEEPLTDDERALLEALVSSRNALRTLMEHLVCPPPGGWGKPAELDDDDLALVGPAWLPPRPCWKGHCRRCGQGRRVSLKRMAELLHGTDKDATVTPFLFLGGKKTTRPSGRASDAIAALEQVLTSGAARKGAFQDCRSTVATAGRDHYWLAVVQHHAVSMWRTVGRHVAINRRLGGVVFLSQDYSATFVASGLAEGTGVTAALDRTVSILVTCAEWYASGTRRRITHFGLASCGGAAADMVQDAVHAYGGTLKAIAAIKTRGAQPHLIVISRDGAAKHFKSNAGQFLTTRLARESGVPVVVVTCAPGHGKGPHDGQGGVAKAYLTGIHLERDVPGGGDDYVTELVSILSGDPRFQPRDGGTYDAYIYEHVPANDANSVALRAEVKEMTARVVDAETGELAQKSVKPSFEISALPDRDVFHASDCSCGCVSCALNLIHGDLYPCFSSTFTTAPSRVLRYTGRAPGDGFEPSPPASQAALAPGPEARRSRRVNAGMHSQGGLADALRALRGDPDRDSEGPPPRLEDPATPPPPPRASHPRPTPQDPDGHGEDVPPPIRGTLVRLGADVCEACMSENGRKFLPRFTEPMTTHDWRRVHGVMDQETLTEDVRRSLEDSTTRRLHEVGEVEYVKLIPGVVSRIRAEWLKKFGPRGKREVDPRLPVADGDISVSFSKSSAGTTIWPVPGKIVQHVMWALLAASDAAGSHITNSQLATGANDTVVVPVPLWRPKGLVRVVISQPAADASRPPTEYVQACFLPPQRR